MMNRFFLASALFVLTGCGRERDQKARAEIHAAGFAYSVDDFLRASREGREEIVREFLSAGMNPNAADAKGGTAVSSAAAGGHGHVVALLLSHGATPNHASPEGQTALMAAAESGDEEAVKALLSAGADAQAKNGAGVSPLAAAVLAGQASVVAILADRAPGALDHALQLAAVKGHTPVLSVLLDRGASPHSVSPDGRTPMMFAAQYGHLEAVKLLRQRGGAVTALDRELKTPASYAEENGHDGLAAYLREPDRNADPFLPDIPPQRLTEVVFTADAPANLGSLAASVRLIDYHSRPLPVMVVEVPEGDSGASIRMLSPGEGSMDVSPGMEIPGLGLTVESVKRRFITSKHGQGRTVDVSEVLFVEPATGQHILAVKGLPVMAGEGCALATFPGVEAPLDVRRGDVFSAGGMPLRIVDVRPAQIIMERTDTKESAAIGRAGN